MRLPVLPTVLVAAAVATMIGLGVWQLQRREWKEDLIARHQRAATMAETAWPAFPAAGDELLYRRASGFCLEVMGWRSTGGRNRKGEGGWIHIASCRTGAEGPGMQVDMGWSRSGDAPKGWRGGPVTGIIAPDRDHHIRLVSSAPAPGLIASAVPSPAETPNNHLFYALQWFFFAGAAAIIYWLALRRRASTGAGAGKGLEPLG